VDTEGELAHADNIESETRSSAEETDKELKEFVLSSLAYFLSTCRYVMMTAINPKMKITDNQKNQKNQMSKSIMRCSWLGFSFIKWESQWW